jgi:hypothetical protein
MTMAGDVLVLLSLFDTPAAEKGECIHPENRPF